MVVGGVVVAGAEDGAVEFDGVDVDYHAFARIEVSDCGFVCLYAAMELSRLEVGVENYDFVEIEGCAGWTPFCFGAEYAARLPYYAECREEMCGALYVSSGIVVVAAQAYICRAHFFVFLRVMTVISGVAPIRAGMPTVPMPVLTWSCCRYSPYRSPHVV